MAVTISMPKLSDTMTTGTLVSWLKKEGDKVSSGDMIASIETDKATMDLENFEDGILLKQFVKEGEEVSVGEPICAVGEKGEKVDAPSGGSSGKKDSGKKEEKKESKKSDDGASEKEQEESSEDAPKSSSSGETPDLPPAHGSSSDRLKASPLARRIAAEKGLALEGVSGTGPGGRIVKADVLAAPAGGAPASKAPTAAPAAVHLGKTIAEEGDLPVSKMRGIIAQRLLESKTQIPHFYLELEVDMEPLLALRSQINNALAGVPPAQGGIKLSVNDFVIKACAEALRRVPAVNTSWQGSTVRQHSRAHVSFAVAIDDGLVTPVIQDCHIKSLRDISIEAKDLARRARDRKLKPDEMSGGTFCISNLGMMGIERFSAIINPPNTAILAVGATVRKPVVKGDAIVIGQRMSLTLSADHRVVDGAVGALFLASLKNILENPATIMV